MQKCFPRKSPETTRNVLESLPRQELNHSRYPSVSPSLDHRHLRYKFGVFEPGCSDHMGGPCDDGVDEKRNVSRIELAISVDIHQNVRAAIQGSSNSLLKGSPQTERFGMNQYVGASQPALFRRLIPGTIVDDQDFDPGDISDLTRDARNDAGYGLLLVEAGDRH